MSESSLSLRGSFPVSGAMRALIMRVPRVTQPRPAWVIGSVRDRPFLVMGKRMASIMIVYGILLALLSFTIQRVAPAVGKAIFVAEMAGGGLCVVWGIVAMAGHKRRTWAIFTLIALMIIALGQVVLAWSTFVEVDGSSIGPLLLTLVLLLTMATLIYLVHGERPPEFYSAGTARPDNSGSPRSVASSGRGRLQR